MIASYLRDAPPASRYARFNEVSRCPRWDVERDVIRGRGLEPIHKFLPDGLSFADRLPFLAPTERRLLSRVQGRSYANLCGLAERFLGIKMVELSREHALGDQEAAEALVRFGQDELKHQHLFRRIEALAARAVPARWRFVGDADEVTAFVLGKSNWAVIALTCLMDVATEAHYRHSLEPDAELSPLFKDVLFFHWKEASQHAVLDELEWRRIDARAGAFGRDHGVGDLVGLLVGLDEVLRAQAKADTATFLEACGSSFTAEEAAQADQAMLAAYRWQHIVSGLREPRFAAALHDMISRRQSERLASALATIVASVDRLCRP